MGKLIWAPILLVVAACSAESGNRADPENRAENRAESDEKPLAIKASDSALQWGACPPIFPQGCEIAVLHGAPDQPNADVFLRVPGGYEIPPHRHTSAERMILVSGNLQVEYQGSAPASLSAGDYAYGPASLPHRATCASQEPCTLFIAFEGPVDAEAAELAAS